jgi:hypothetical protein
MLKELSLLADFGPNVILASLAWMHMLTDVQKYQSHFTITSRAQRTDGHPPNEQNHREARRSMQFNRKQRTMAQQHRLFWPSRRVAATAATRLYCQQTSRHRLHTRIRHLPLRQSSFPPTWFRCSVTSHPELFTTAAWTDTIDTDDGIEEKDAVSDSVFATVDDGNPDEDLFDSMVQAINDNVKAILEKHQQLISSNTNESTQSRTIQERWLTVFEREKRMLRRTMRNNHPKTTSCDELWSKALVAMHQHEPFSPPTSSQERFDFDDEVLTAQLYHSPIFGLAMNDQFGIDDMDACVVNHVNKEPLQDVLDDREEEEDLTMQLQELESLVGKSLNDDMRQQRLYHEAMLRSIALLSVMDVKDWRRIECRD